MSTTRKGNEISYNSAQNSEDGVLFWRTGIGWLRKRWSDLITQLRAALVVDSLAGTSTQTAPSVRAVNNAVSAVGTPSYLQTTGSANDQAMSQAAVTNEVNALISALASKQPALGASIVAALFDADSPSGGNVFVTQSELSTVTRQPITLINAGIPSGSLITTPANENIPAVAGDIVINSNQQFRFYRYDGEVWIDTNQQLTPST